MASITAYSTVQGKRYRVRYRRPDRTQTDKRGFKTKREAELFIANVEVSKARGEYINVSDSRVRIGDLGGIWLSHQTHLKPSSLRPVEIAWRLYVEPRWGGTSVADIRHSDVQEWVSQISAVRGATTVLRAYGVLANILDVAVRDRRLLSNPARGLNLPRKVRKEHVYLSHEQVHALAATSGEHRALVLLLAYTGLRWGEAIGLRVKDIDFELRRIRVSVNAVEVGRNIEVGTPKSHKRRAVPFPHLIDEAIIAKCAGKAVNDLVFGDRFGQHMRRTRVDVNHRSWLRTAMAETKLPPMTIHDLRHTAVSLSVSAGANIKAIQRMLGHASAAMTLDVYADLFDDDLGAVSDRLDEAFARTDVGKMWAADKKAVS